MRWGRLLAALCALPLLNVAVARAETQPPVIMGEIRLSFYAVTGAVVQQVLERLGHTVEVTEGSHAEIFPRLGAGEVDLLVAAWLPHGHAMYWEKYGARAEPLAVLYRDARFAWMVPAYVPVSVLADIDDLKRPDVLSRVDHDIRGTGRDSGNMIVSAEVMKGYGLDSSGYRLVPGTLADFYQNYEQAIAAQRWFVMPLWWPHFINQLGTMRPLAEPKGLLGEPNDGTLVANKTWVARAPAATLRVLGRIQLGLDAVAQMDRWVNVEGMTPHASAARWMQENALAVDAWFETP